MEEVVNIRNLRKVYRSFLPRVNVVAVDDVSFSVARGEVFGLLGPNGSGKTTTLKSLLGLIRPTSGGVTVFGMPPTSRKVRARVGYLPEATPLYGFLDAYETLDFFGRLSGLSRKEARKRAEALFERLDLKAPRRRISSYSKGMARKVAFAQAVLAGPGLLVLDEPTGGLDPVSAVAVKEILAEMKAAGTTMIVSSHILSEIQQMCDRAVILAEGRVRAEGSLDRLLEREGYVRVTLKARIEDKEQVLSALDSAGLRVESIEADSVGLDTLFLRVIGRNVAGGESSV